jgi:bacterioferritin (cytochrome b1)
VYEEIDLDAIESNKDEAPDYRPLLESSSQSLGARPDINYRMRYLSSLESQEKASYAEFAKIADKEGMKKIASVFRDILQDEKSHADELEQKNNTMMNLRTSIKGELNKMDTIKSVMDQAEKEKDTNVVDKLKAMLDEEQGHVEKLSKALEGLEEEMGQMKKAKKGMGEKPRELCTYGVCVPKPKRE